jgi:poly-D-alanine transfer protein DltD
MTLHDWYLNPEPQQELRRLMEATVLGSALELLQARAKVGAITSADTTFLALQHAVASGYQKALDDLEALSRPHIQKKIKPLPKHWESAAPEQ